jgi:hypothetical protein
MRLVLIGALDLKYGGVPANLSNSAPSGFLCERLKFERARPFYDLDRSMKRRSVEVPCRQ